MMEEYRRPLQHEDHAEYLWRMWCKEVGVPLCDRWQNRVIERSRREVYIGEGKSGQGEYDTCREDLRDDHQAMMNIGNVG
jgi:hypothetical protein